MNNITISYAILTHNETESLQKLLDFLIKYKDDDDEIVILDDFSDNKETKELLDVYTSIYGIKFEQRYLFADFSGQKNHLRKMCSKDYIINIDADELPRKHLIKNIKDILETNPEVDVIWIPRINTVEGLREEHIQKWKWSIGKLKSEKRSKFLDKESSEYKLLERYDLLIGEESGGLIKFYAPLINWPNDYQARLWKNRPNIRWTKEVHETLEGYNNYTFLPAEGKYCFEHHKTIERQEKQNKFYEGILS